jgi:hypothetical protein
VTESQSPPLYTLPVPLLPRDLARYRLRALSAGVAPTAAALPSFASHDLQALPAPLLRAQSEGLRGLEFGGPRFEYVRACGGTAFEVCALDGTAVRACCAPRAVVRWLTSSGTQIAGSQLIMDAADATNDTCPEFVDTPLLELASPLRTQARHAQLARQTPANRCRRQVFEVDALQPRSVLRPRYTLEGFSSRCDRSVSPLPCMGQAGAQLARARVPRRRRQHTSDSDSDFGGDDALAASRSAPARMRNRRAAEPAAGAAPARARVNDRLTPTEQQPTQRRRLTWREHGPRPHAPASLSRCSSAWLWVRTTPSRHRRESSRICIVPGRGCVLRF